MAEKKKKKSTSKVVNKTTKEGIEEIFATSPNKDKDDFVKPQKKRRKKETSVKKDADKKEDTTIKVESPKEEKEESKVVEPTITIEENETNKKESVLTATFMAVIIIGIICFSTLNRINHKLEEVDKKLQKTDSKIEYVNPKTLFLGDSITYGWDLNKFFTDSYINKGINGAVTNDLIDRVKEDVIDYQPKKIFILIGTNDLGNGKKPAEVVNNIDKLIRMIQSESKNTKIYVESILPVNDSDDREEHHDLEKRDNSVTKKTNEELKELCKRRNVTYIHTYDEFLNEDGNLKLDYTYDGLHLNNEGYEKLKNIIKKYL